jgi:exopolyphosphatase/guanosine-5'-triphosphate,3'-diphosphate pyrophosphatase
MSYIPDETYVAVDLGSNSFHMIVANYSDDRLQVIDKLKEMVRLASGLDAGNNLTDDAAAKAIQCLERFGQRIREIPLRNVRAVGTNTLRKARNGPAFLRAAHRALGHRIEIISGLEEARLVYLGVAHFMYHESEKRLVVDIGGGSTEVIIGRGFQHLDMESLYMGCVSITQRFFEDGQITAKKMRKAILAARQELEIIEARFKKTGWSTAIGSSGTNLCIHDIIRNQSWSDSGITAAGLERLKAALIDTGDINKVNLEGLPEQRRPVFAGGVAILCAVFEALQIERMVVSDGALREGLLHDLLGRLHDQDIRDKTIDDLGQRYAIDREQAQRVEDSVRQLFNKAREPWSLSRDADLKLLTWSARLHELGMAVAHAQHHKHGAYLISNSDMPGFSNQEQQKLAMLVRSHRRKFPQPEELAAIPQEELPGVMRLCILLRLAVLLNRGRSSSDLARIRISPDENSLSLKFPKDWLVKRPLTLADLETEAEFLQAIKFSLTFG